MGCKHKQAALLLLSYITYSVTAVIFTPLQPPSFPLAVRSPYLSAWIPGSNATSLATETAQFWYGQSLGWTIATRVGNASYSLFGNPGIGDPAEVISAEYTSTQSIFLVSAGSVNFTLDFFSPVSPKNYVRQSLPFSYLTVSVSGATEAIAIYSDVDASWMGNSDGDFNYSASVLDNATFYSITPTVPLLFSESDQLPLWGQIIYGTRQDSNLTTQIGSSTDVRSQFSSSGQLSGASNITSTSETVAGFAQSITIDQPAIFAIGQQRDESINYLGTSMTPYYRSQHPDVSSAVSWFLNDYEDALAETQQLDANINSQAQQVYDSETNGSDYYSIISLALRQSFGGIEIVVPYSNTSTDDAMAFVKEISSDGNVNTLGVIFSHFALHYAANPDLLRLLMTPVLDYLATGRWPNAFAIHDIGSNYPNATGHDDGDAELMPVEDSGNVNLLTYAYVYASGDNTWATQYQSILEGYAAYLATNGWYPVYQYSTTDGAGKLANQTVLATKAALGMQCFGTLFNNSSYVDNATALASLLYDDGLAIAADGSHFDLSYGNDSSWLSDYNLFPVKLYDFDLFPQEAYDMQSAWLPTVRLTDGIPLDSRVVWTRSDLGLYVAAVSDQNLRSIWITDIVNYLSNGLNDVPFSDRWFVGGSNAGKTGENFRARPTVGGHFALIALDSGPGAILEGID